MSNTFYKIETHAHTSEASACSRVSGAELADYYKNEGYSALVITDHFLNGNTTARDPSVPWEERINILCSGYENAAKRGSEIGLPVFFGWEYSSCGNDFLIYGIDKDWLLCHPDVCEWNIKDFFDRIHTDGGFVIHAHPFREAPYVECTRLFPRHIDAMEIFNSGNKNRPAQADKMAQLYAETYGLAISAGTDTHIVPPDSVSGILMPNKPSSILDIIEAIRNKTVRPILPETEK